MTREAWLSEHPFLQALAHFHEQIESATASLPISGACAPNWDDYKEDYLAGVPLLMSLVPGIDYEVAGTVVAALVDRIASLTLPEGLAQECRALDAELKSGSDTRRRAVAWLLGAGEFASASPGMLRCLAWKALAWHLSPIAAAFGNWRDEALWMRNYCPTCGAPPAMAQLVGTDPGRLRLLSCGCCGTRWRYRRTGCPYCETHDDDRLAVVTVEGQGGLRIDYCASCSGYLKTYEGEGSERLLLADWTSLHLDILARDRGLKRAAGSLYEF